MSMTDFWKDFGLGLMNLFDLPGSMVRDVFAWENPLDQIASPFSAKNRATGADVLRNFGVEDPGMLSGMGVEMMLDPLMLAGGLGALKGAKMSAKLGPRYRTMFREPLSHPGGPSSSLEKYILREVPPGSRKIGAGAEAQVFETPSGTVVRVERSPLGGGNLHNVEAPMSEFIEHGRVPDIPEIIPVRRNVVIRADDMGGGQQQLMQQWGRETGSWVETPVAGTNRLGGYNPLHERVRITHSPKATEIPATGLEYGQGAGRRVPRDFLGEAGPELRWNVDPISDAEKAAAVRARMDPHFGKTLVSDDLTRAHPVDVSTGGPTKGGMLDRAAAQHELQEEFIRAKGRVSDDEFNNLIRSLEDRGLDPWDVRSTVYGARTKGGRNIANTMLHEGRAVVPDLGAIRQRGQLPGQQGLHRRGLFEERGGSFIEPEIIDITSGRTSGRKISDALMDMIWDPITAATGHRARTRAAVSGLEPGMYGRVMPYIAPVIPPSLRMARPLIGTEEEEPDVLGAL